MKKLFLNESIILVVIIANAIIIFAQECGINSSLLNVIDVVCTCLFIIEMIVKQVEFGIKGYWSKGMNILDGILVLCSIPSIIALFLPNSIIDLSFLLILRILRIFRFFRIIHAFPGFSQIAHNFGMALKRSYAVMLGLVIMIITFALISCSLFREAVPEYFSNPFEAIYTTFRIFTGEGWNEIPDAVAESVGDIYGHIVRVYFCAILVLGSIIGMSLLNSIFVDAMVSDNNDDVYRRLNEIETKIDKLLKENDKHI